MNEIKEHLRDISAIRTMMDQHSKFISLSGLSGVSVGLVALLSIWAAQEIVGDRMLVRGPELDAVARKLILLAAGTLLVSVVLAVAFSLRMSRRKSLPFWNRSAARMLAHLAVPLAAGGAFCAIQFSQGIFFWIPATTLMFYGMALMSAAKYTIREIRLLGVCEIALGLACAAWPQHSVAFWAAGFGILHILYGIVIYIRHER